MIHQQVFLYLGEQGDQHEQTAPTPQRRHRSIHYYSAISHGHYNPFKPKSFAQSNEGWPADIRQPLNCRRDYADSNEYPDLAGTLLQPGRHPLATPREIPQ